MTGAERGRLCTIFKGSRRDELYIYVDKQCGLESLPQELLDSLGTISEVMTLMITPQRKLARVSAARVLEEIAGKGYFVQMPPSLYPEAEAAR